MKYLILLILLFTTQVKATTIENVIGGLTYHFSDEVADRYANKMTSDGKLIFTGLLGLGLTENNYSYRMFMGQNSIGEFMLGGTVSYTWDLLLLRAGPILGAYFQNDDKFKDKGIIPFSLGNGIVPIVGAELSFKIFNIDDNKYLISHTIVTPVIINQTIGVAADL